MTAVFMAHVSNRKATRIAERRRVVVRVPVRVELCRTGGVQGIRADEVADTGIVVASPVLNQPSVVVLDVSEKRPVRDGLQQITTALRAVWRVVLTRDGTCSGVYGDLRTALRVIEQPGE